MSNYTKSTNFTAKDSLPTGDTNKVIRGSEFDTEFNAISVAVATKSDLAGPTFTGTATFADLTGTGTINFTGATVSNLGTVTTVDINGGTIDGVTIGGSSAGAGTFSSLTATTADINGGTVDGVTIGGSSAGAGTFSSLVATTADINAGTVDNTVIGGTTPAAGTFSSLTATTANIDGGSIDGAVIGGSTPAAVSGTTGTFSGAVSGTTGTFSGAVTGFNLNVSNWDTAYGWGDHSTQGYLTSVTFSDIDAGAVTTSGETFANSDTQIPTNAAVRNWVLTAYPTIVENNDLTANVTWATVPDAYISASSVNQHVSVEKATQSKTYTLNETSTLTLSSSITSGVPVVSVTKEVPQTGVTNNDWDVNSSTENYTRLNSATATTLTPSAVGDGTFTLGTGSFTSADVGKTIEGNGGVAILTATDGSYITTTNFTDTSTIASGSWEMYAVVYNTTDGDLELSKFIENFDVSTATYNSVSFSVASQDSAPKNIAFNTDGTKMFVVGSTTTDVYEYTLSTGFDLSTASYSQSFDVNSQETAPQGIAFNPDGTKMFICGYNGIEVNSYSLSTGFDISTASFVTNFSVASQEIYPYGVEFNNDGTKMFISGNEGLDISEYALSTGFDISTASYTQRFSVSAQETSVTSVRFNNDGTKMFVAGASSDSVHEYNLSTGFDVSTASYSQSFDASSFDTQISAVAFNNDGSKMYLTGSNADVIFEFTLGSTYIPSGYHAVHTTTSTDSQYWTDVNSMTADEAAGDGAIYYAVSTDDRTTWKIARGTDGERSIVRNNAGTWQYNSNGTYGSTTWTNGTTNTELATLQEAMEGAEAGYGLSDASYDSVSFSVASQDTTPEEVLFNPSGTKMYILGSSNDTVFEYDLTTAFDITTASYQRSKSVTTEDIYPTGMAFNSDGTKMYILGNVNDSVFQYSLSTAYDVSTASYDSVSFSVTSQDTQPYGLAFNTDGTKMFVGGNTGDDVNEYSLSTGFDISTASYTQNFSIASQEANIRHVSFKPDGTRMYIVGLADDVYEYKLTTAFDLSTASFFQTFAMNTEDTSTHGITFNSDGTKMFMVGQSQDKVFQYSTPVYINRMDKTQLDAVPDANHFTLGNDLDLAIIFNLSSGTTVPSSDGVAINFDANSLNQGAILGTDYNWDFPAANKVRITSLAAQNLKVRVL